MSRPPPALLVATTNPFKARRWRRVLGDLTGLVLPADIDAHLTVQEGQSSTIENSRAKAVAWCAASGLPTLADDLGLNIRALDGFPGAAVKTWGGTITESASENERMTALHDCVHNLSDTTCCLETAITLALPDGRLAQHIHRDTGRIDQTRTGLPHTSGALLEWVFIIDLYQKSWREMTNEERAQMDHSLRTEVIRRLLRPFGLAPAVPP